MSAPDPASVCHPGRRQPVRSWCRSGGVMGAEVPLLGAALCTHPHPGTHPTPCPCLHSGMDRAADWGQNWSGSSSASEANLLEMLRQSHPSCIPSLCPCPGEGSTGEGGVGAESVGSHPGEGLWVSRRAPLGPCWGAPRRLPRNPGNCDWLPEMHGHSSVGVTPPPQEEKLLVVKCFFSPPQFTVISWS